MRKLYLSIVYGVVGVLSSVPLLSNVFAAETINLKPGADTPFSKVASTPPTLSKFITTAITIILIFAALAFFVMLVLGGIRWIMSGGEKSNVENARKQITNALIGLAIIFVAWAIIQLMGYIFGVNLLQDMTVPTLVP